MKSIGIAVVALVTIGLVGPSFAQMSASTRSQLSQMRAKDPVGFNACQALAFQRGYRGSDNEKDGRGLMNFINGCLMGRHR
jgi:hypothetical protein